MRRGRSSAAALVLVSIVAAIASMTSAPPVVARAPAPEPARAPLEVPREQRVYVVSESVGLGARSALPLAFPPGWQVTVDGTPALFVEQLESKHVRERMASSPWVFGDVAVVAGGHNYPFWDPGRFDRSIDSIIGALREAGVQRIYWVTLREVKPQFISPSAWTQVQPYFWYFPTVNEHLRRALDRHPDLTLVDWAAVADQPGLTYDAIHLNPTGAALYSHLIASTVLATRQRPLAGAVTEVSVGTAGEEATAPPAAVAANIAVVHPRSGGFLTAYPCSDAAPFVASATFARDQIVASAAIVPVSRDGTICVRGSEATHVVVDVTGAFPTGAGLLPVTPTRLADSRELGARVRAGEPLVVPVAGVGEIADDAGAVAVTVTATGSSAAGYATVAPCGTDPNGTANVNFDAGATVPNLAIVEPGAGGAICVTPNVDAHLVVDVFAVFDAEADMGVVDATRLLDTRLGADARLAAGGTVRLHVSGEHGVPDAATGVVLNLTGVDPGADGYLTAYPCAAGAPLTSSLNLAAGTNRGNLVIVAPDDAGDVCVSTYGPTDVVVDLFGWMGAAFDGATPTRLVDTRDAG